ncbi:MAG TPA: hypothetical protein VMM82_05410, partial [Spirochaetia bacterium]|nr:hypothetical protein [Spirochaetia bacterium]
KSRNWRAIALCFVLTAFFPVAAAAQDQPSHVPGTSPTMVLPEVTVNIQDLSVENVQAMLPPAGGPPVIVKTDVILPPAPLVAVEPPVRTLAVEGADPLGGAGSPGSPLATQATLGIGSQNRVVGDLNVTATGQNAQASLSFSHDTADGISGHAQGSEFDTRDDAIGGSLSGRIGAFDGGFQGAYSEKEVGLQNQSANYSSRLGRNLDGTATLRVQPMDWLAVDGSLSGLTDSLTLGGTNPGPAQASEYKGLAHMGATGLWGVFSAGVFGDYSYRLAHQVTATDDQVQRLNTGLKMSLNFPGSFLLEGSVAWFLSSQGASMLPFSIHVTGAPFSALTLDASFGYRVVTYDQGDILGLNPYLIPVGLADDHGWFGDAGVQIALADSFSFNVGLSFMASTSMLTSDAFAAGPASTLDGLFLVNQVAANRLTGNAGVRWTIIPGVTLNGEWKRELMERPSFAPVDTITAEAIAMETTGAFGGRAGMTWLTGLPPSAQLPELDVGGFVRLSEPAQLHLDLYDLLWPLLGGSRYGPSLDPYVEPGFRVVASLRLSF